MHKQLFLCVTQVVARSWLPGSGGFCAFFGRGHISCTQAVSAGRYLALTLLLLLLLLAGGGLCVCMVCRGSGMVREGCVYV